MSEHEDISNDIQASLEKFTSRLDEVNSDQFNAMRNCSFFDPVPSKELAAISRKAKVRTYAVGAKLLKQGDAMGAFYVVVYGSATAYVDGENVGTIHSGECIGEGAFIGRADFIRSASVIANGELITVEIPKDDIHELDDDARAYMNKAVLLALYRKLQNANHKILKLLKEKHPLGQ